MGWYGFGRLFLIPGSCSLPFERHVSGFPPDSVTLRCFLVFLQDSFAFFGFFCFLLDYLGLPRFRVFLTFLQVFSSFLRLFGLLSGLLCHLVFFQDSLPSLDFLFLASVRTSCSLLWNPADSCGLLRIPGLPSR